MTRNSDRQRGHVASTMARLIVSLKPYRFRPPVQAIASEIGVCKRTAQRYIKALDDAGWQLPQQRRIG